MVTIPRTIEGNIGSRIRLIFGDTGNEWLLITDNDNGDRKWQTHNWKSIPAKVAKQLNNCTAKGREVKNIDFGSGGAWYINAKKPDGSGGYNWWGGTTDSVDDNIKKESGVMKVSFGTNAVGLKSHVIITGRNGYNFNFVHETLGDRINRINSRNKAIDFVRLFENGQFYISDDEGSQWSLNDHCSDAITKNNDVKEVAVAKDGSWVVICKDKYISSTGVDEDLTKELSTFYSTQRRWINDRKREIREAREQEEQEAAVRARIERLELEREAAAERLVRALAEREERERAQLEARQRDRAEREREAADRHEVTRISVLAAQLEDRLKEEHKEIKDMEAILYRKKQSFQATLDSMPPETRSRIISEEDRDELGTDSNSANLCVICNDTPSVYAILPCGHFCLCEECSTPCNVCPLCRGNKENMLKIYLGR